MRTPEDEGKLPSPDDKAEKADFEMMDVDKNGFLNSNETLAKHEGEEEEDEEFRNDEFAAEFMAIDKQMEQLMFTQADANHDGLLSPQEYVNYRCVATDGGAHRGARRTWHMRVLDTSLLALARLE
jgi:hypothetical protein